MIQLLGLDNVMTEEAINYIRRGIADQNTEVRRIAVESVGHMAPESRAKFKPDLLRLLANPNEDAAVRAVVERVVQQ